MDGQPPTSAPTQAMLEKEEINRRLDKLDKDVREIGKQFASIQNSLNAIYEDRDLITDVINDLDKVRSLIVAADKNNTNLAKETQYVVEKKSEQVKAEVHVTTHDVKNTIVQKVVTGITKQFKSEDKSLVKRPWYKRLLFWNKQSTVELAV